MLWSIPEGESWNVSNINDNLKMIYLLYRKAVCDDIKLKQEK